MKVERRQIVDAALDLLNEVGLDQLTTRRLAERLKVQQPALYWHFRNKGELLAAMNEEILARGHDYTPEESADWRTVMRDGAHSFRRALLAFRDGARVHAGTEPPLSGLAGIEARLVRLTDAGVPLGLAMDGMVTVGRYALGYVLEEQAEEAAAPDRPGLDAAVSAFPQLRQGIAAYRQRSHAELFDAGLTLLIEGMAAGWERERAVSLTAGGKRQ